MDDSAISDVLERFDCDDAEIVRLRGRDKVVVASLCRGVWIDDEPGDAAP